MAALRSESAARLQDVDEWCRGEVEAVQHVAQGQVAQAHEEVTRWWGQGREGGRWAAIVGSDW